jgi:hypothetical protein
MTTATKKKSADVWEKVERALSTLSTEGMIASLEYFTFNKESELTLLSRGQEVVIYCTLYFRDTDDEGNPAGLYYLDKERETMRDLSGNCSFCGTHVKKPREHLDLSPLNPGRYKTKNRFRCPIKFCGHWAPPSFKRKTYAGIFRIVYGGDTIFEGPVNDPHTERMTNEPQIDAIKRVITKAFQ